MTTPDWLTELAEKAAKATAEPSGAETRTSMEYAAACDVFEAACAPEAIAALVAVALAARDVSCCGGCGMEGDACRKPLDAALASLDACAAGRIA